MLAGTVAAAPQDIPTPASGADPAPVLADVELEEIVVTGTRIPHASALQGPVPVTAVEASLLVNKGDVILGEALNELPPLRATLGQDDTLGIFGFPGLNFLDLRGLGFERTLVLVNGRRHVTSSAGDYFVDVNTIPSTLVERVDIVTGGNSAIYGSDAIAGVVNFIMRRDFDGLEIRSQAGTSDRGDRDTISASVTAGTDFDDGRGNAAFSLEYTDSEPLYFWQRNDLTGAFSGRSQWNLAEVVSGEAGGSDGIPDNRFFRGGIYNGNMADGGLISVNASGNPASSVYCGRLPEPVRTQRCLPNNQPRIFTFDRRGDLIETVPDIDFRAFGSGNVHLPPGSRNGGDLSTLRNTGQLAVGLQMLSSNLLARYVISDALVPFLDAKYVASDTVQETQPSFWQGSITGFFGGGAELRCNNPFLSPQALSVLQAMGRCGNPATGVFTMSRFNVDFGGRRELPDRTTTRVVAGVEGRFNGDWRYEVSLNYGRYANDMHALRNLVLYDVDGNADGFLLALDAVRDAAGNIVCRVNGDQDSTNDRPDCVPINVFGVGAASRAALDFVNTTSRMTERAEQYDVLAFISGDSSNWFALAGGPVTFVIGAESRVEKASIYFDELTAADATFYYGVRPFDPPDLDVHEAFAELRLPLIADAAYAHELAIQGAYRHSDYSSETGTVSSYNVGLVYAPVADVRFRSSYSSSIRAPTQWNLYASEVPGYQSLMDPCDIIYVGANPNRAANCAAAGVPPGFVNGPARDSQLETMWSGNPLLEEEQSESVTLGLVIMPNQVPGFSVAIDYYDIEVVDIIEAVGPQDVLNNCYDSPGGIDNPYCSRIYRDADGYFASPAVRDGYFNFARQETSGVDVDASFSTTSGGGHRFSARGIATYLLELNNYLFPAEPERPNRQKSELGDPELGFNVYLAYGIAKLDLSYSYRYIGKMTIGTYEAQHSFNHEPPQNRDAYPRKWYPATAYHGARGEYQVTSSLRLFGGIDNLTDESPPFYQLGINNASPYDTVGRYYYLGFQLQH